MICMRPLNAARAPNVNSGKLVFRMRSAYPWYPKPGMTKMEMFNAQMKRKMILFRGAMIRRRMWKLPFMRDAHVMSISDMAGHSAFLFLAASYMATDISDLRITAMSGITLSIIFQYYREKPLWIPIRWNMLFLFINTVLLYLLFKESNDADNLPEEQKLLFTQLFKDVGAMKMEDMLHLMMVANREEFQPGSKLISSGRRRHHIYLVLSGKCTVISRNGDALGTIGPNQFISEQSFVTWQTKFAHAHEKRKKEQQALSQFVKYEKVGNPEIINAQIGGVGNGSGIAGDPTDAHIPIVTNFFTWMWPPENNEYAASSTAGNGAGPKYAEGVLEEDRFMHLQDDAPRSEWLVGKADIVVEEPTVVYSWRFPVLHDMILKRPSIGVVFERLISADLNRKMLANSTLATSRSYKQMISGALLEGDKVSLKTRRFLEKYRTERGISESEHVALVEELGWTVAEFEKGRKGKEGKEFEVYLSMVKEVLVGEVITPQQKRELRKYRKANKINSECHERYIQSCGWTPDEYEQGYKESYIPGHQTDEDSMYPTAAASAAVKKRKTPVLDWLTHAYDHFTSPYPKFFLDPGFEDENSAFVSPSPKSVSFFQDPDAKQEAVSATSTVTAAVAAATSDPSILAPVLAPGLASSPEVAGPTLPAATIAMAATKSTTRADAAGTTSTSLSGANKE